MPRKMAPFQGVLAAAPPGLCTLDAAPALALPGDPARGPRLSASRCGAVQRGHDPRRARRPRPFRCSGRSCGARRLRAARKPTCAWATSASTAPLRRCIADYERGEGGDLTLCDRALPKLVGSASSADERRRVPLDPRFYESGTVEHSVNPADEAGPISSTRWRAGGADAFARYFDSIGPRAYEPRLLLALGQHFRRYSLYAEAAEADRLLISRFPRHPDALRSAQRMVETYERWDRPSLAASARLELASRFAPGGDWAAAQTADSARAAGAEPRARRVAHGRAWPVTARRARRARAPTINRRSGSTSGAARWRATSDRRISSGGRGERALGSTRGRSDTRRGRPHGPRQRGRSGDVAARRRDGPVVSRHTRGGPVGAAVRAGRHARRSVRRGRRAAGLCAPRGGADVAAGARVRHAIGDRAAQDFGTLSRAARDRRAPVAGGLRADACSAQRYGDAGAAHAKRARRGEAGGSLALRAEQAIR